MGNIVNPHPVRLVEWLSIYFSLLVPNAHCSNAPLCYGALLEKVVQSLFLQLPMIGYTSCENRYSIQDRKEGGGAEKWLLQPRKEADVLITPLPERKGNDKA